MKSPALRSTRDRLLASIRTIESARRAGEPNYITDGIYQDGQLFRFACADINERYQRRRIEKVIAYDSAALPLAAPLAYFLWPTSCIADLNWPQLPLSCAKAKVS